VRRRSARFIEGTLRAIIDTMAGAVTSDRFVAGERVSDYQIEREVGEDATGIIYLATHVVLPRQAHLKVTREGERTQAVQLLREACILEAMAQPGQPGHPGIPRVYECGVLPDRRPWSAVERISGITFERYVGPGPAGLADLVLCVREVADILRHVHERGVVHGGLTAGAIVRSHRRRSAYAIVDWACARALDADADMTIDPRADVHALGVIAFWALVGAPPGPGVATSTFCPTLPAELLTLIDQMLAEPVARPAAAEVFDRAVWLCETLQIAPLIERPRWTPPQGFVPEQVSSPDPEDDPGGFAIRIGRTRSS
jgi:serine/threonine protein kinase